MSRRLRIVDSVSDPTVDIGPPVSDVLPDAKSHGALSPVAPRVQRPDGEVEEFRKLLHGEQAVAVVHARIVEESPVARVS